MLKLSENHPYKDGRTCTTCGEFKPISDFQLEKDVRSFEGITVRSKCRPCNEFRKYKAFIKKVYGISYESYLEILERQGFGCAICQSKVANSTRTSNKLFIDHDHETGKVRGLLCSRCNYALGQFDDRIDLLQNAILYLKSCFKEKI
jgi:hypothetical protein